MPKVSIIISVYNKADYLKLVIAGLQRQTFQDLEIIIADDGSEEGFVGEVEMISRRFDNSLVHLWHEDNGFRKNKILNRAILAASSDYLIFIDGDCVPHREFINEHYKNREKGTCLTGRRVNLSEKITNCLNEENVLNGYLEKQFMLLLLDGIFGKSTDVEKGIYFTRQYLRNKFNKKLRGLLGCNFSIHKDELIDINGFDERYQTPSVGEDTDVQYRLELKNIKIRSLNNIAIQYHLYHKIQNRPQKNLILFESVKSKMEFFTLFGIKKLKTNSN